MAFLIPENISSRNDVPETLQTVARALRDHASDEITVWLETPETDPYLLVLDPALGIVLIDVPTIDGQGLAQRLRLRSRSIEEVDRLSAAIVDRVSQLRSRLGSEPRLDALPVAAVQALPNRSREAIAQLSVNPQEIISMEDLATEDDIRSAFARVLGIDSPRQLTDTQEKVVRGILKPEIIISGARNNGTGQLVFRPPDVAADEVIRVLDRTQERLARHLGSGYRIIRGVAGSGKTLVLTYRAKYLAEYFKNLRILLVCYNVVLSKALGKEVSEFPNIEVRTIDSLAWHVLRQHNQLGDSKGTIDFAERRTQAASLAKNGPASQLFDVVLVDEAQDLDTSGLDLAYAHLKGGREEFVMALDGAQNIYRRRVRWNPPGATARGRTSILRLNYRNTREILDFAIRFLTQGSPQQFDETALAEHDAIVPPEAASRSGPWPKVLTCADDLAEARQVAREVKRLISQGVDPDNIAVLYGNNTMQKRLYRAFKENDLPYFCVTLNGTNKRRVMEVADVRSSTVQGLKGLEFSRVFICGVNDVWLPDADDERESIRRLLYVGMTRAMDELTITVAGDGPIGRELVAT